MECSDNPYRSPVADEGSSVGIYCERSARKKWAWTFGISVILLHISVISALKVAAVRNSNQCLALGCNTFAAGSVLGLICSSFKLIQPQPRVVQLVQACLSGLIAI